MRFSAVSLFVLAILLAVVPASVSASVPPPLSCFSADIKVINLVGGSVSVGKMWQNETSYFPYSMTTRVKITSSPASDTWTIMDHRQAERYLVTNGTCSHREWTLRDDPCQNTDEGIKQFQNTQVHAYAMRDGFCRGGDCDCSTILSMLYYSLDLETMIGRTDYSNGSPSQTTLFANWAFNFESSELDPPAHCNGSETDQ
jgi:hypothetical protein